MLWRKIKQDKGDRVCEEWMGGGRVVLYNVEREKTYNDVIF